MDMINDREKQITVKYLHVVIRSRKITDKHAETYEK